MSDRPKSGRRVNVERGPAEVITSTNTMRTRDGDRMPSDAQFVRSSEGDTSALVPKDHKQSHKYADYELVDVKPKLDGRGQPIRGRDGKHVEELHYKQRG